MNPDSFDDPHSAAIEQLEQFGLSGYAARTFVALVSLGTGTAKDVSGVSDVPRTRVYDAIEELQELGLVDVQQSSPKEFWAISADTTTRKFEQEMGHRLSTLTTALDELEPAQQSEEQRGVWTVDSQEAVTDRVIEFINEADDEIVYMTVEGLLTDDVIDVLRDASERGVTISLGGVSADVQEQIQEEIPNAELFESLWVWSDTPAGRLMMVDGTQTLVSVLVNGADAAPTDPRSETAIWGAGETNSLVVVLKAIFTWRLGNDKPPE
ncbi:TrmB family transcriptional regulator (plasmid) [Halolamina sp. CBA1230]|uniref:TrmB family transcriptional regulator n=1 Tax=Halolamina sp. CBA1230 TaxID=1853690 RepID=UPI0009A16BE4|nr:helix-turn-helix domain-containing protein [Halolamina sp. CBA1230]QKY21792.1 TrmB family transcriptional regulator [Halolamina sp. CBA1230]